MYYHQPYFHLPSEMTVTSLSMCNREIIFFAVRLFDI